MATSSKTVIDASPKVIVRGEPKWAQQNQFSPFKILNYFDRVMDLAKGKDVRPITVEIDPTNICNHDCTWCISKEPRKGNESLTTDDIKRIVVELAEGGVKSIVYKGGGDPLVYRHIIEILNFTHETGLKIGLETNGGPMTFDHIEVLSKTCDWIRISLDAATSRTHALIHQPKRPNDHEKICEAIADLVSYKTSRSSQLTVGINMSVHEVNYDEIISTCKLSAHLGADYIALRNVLPLYIDPVQDSILDHIEHVFYAAQKMEFGKTKVLANFSRHRFKEYHHCMATPLSAVIGADGGVYICCHTRGFDDFCFGNIKDQGFWEIWDSATRKTILSNVYNNHCSLSMCGDRLDHYNKMVNYLAESSKTHIEFV